MTSSSKDLTSRAYDIVEGWFEHNEGEILLALAESWPNEYESAKRIALAEDSDFDMDEGMPNLSMLCEAIQDKSHEDFLDTVRAVIADFNIKSHKSGF